MTASIVNEIWNKDCYCNHFTKFAKRQIDWRLNVEENKMIVIWNCAGAWRWCSFFMMTINYLVATPSTSTLPAADATHQTYDTTQVIHPSLMDQSDAATAKSAWHATGSGAFQ